MNKKLPGIKSVLILGLFIVVNIFSGCVERTANLSSNENAALEKNQKDADKITAPSTANAAAKQDKEILLDFRKGSADKPLDFTKAETDAVLKYLLGDTWDKDLAITSRVSGSFTKLNVKETLYYVTGCDDEAGKFVSNSTCGHVGWDSAGWIAVYDGTTPVLKIKQALGYTVRKATDLDGDGISEIISCGGYGGMGIENESCALGQISDDKYKELKSFSGSADDCASVVSKDKRAVASVVSYKPANGKLPDFSEEYFQTKCQADEIGKNPQWKRVTKKEFDEFSEALR